jgi:hypothetical protein
MSEFLLYLVPILPVVFYLSRGRKWYFLNPINTFWLAYLNFGFVQPLLEKEEWVGYYGEDVFIKTTSMFLVLGVAVAIGYHLKFGKRVAHRIPVICRVESLSKIFGCGIVVTGIGLVAYTYFIIIAGGWSQFTAIARTAIALEWDRAGYLLVLPRLVSPGLLILLCHAYIQKGQKTYKVIVTSLAVLHTLWLLYSGTREGVILMTIIILGSIYGVRRKNPSIVLLVGAALLIVFLNAFIANYRDRFYNLTFNLEGETSSDIYSRAAEFYAPSQSSGQLYLGTEYGMAIAAAYYIPDRLDYDYGYMLLDVFTKYVPRQLWPEKIYPDAEAWDRFHRIARTSNSPNAQGLIGGPAATMVAKYFYILGWPGLILGGLSSGLLFRMTWEHVNRYPAIASTILMVGTSVLGFLEMAHPLGWTILFWVPTVGLPLFFIMFVIRVKPLVRNSHRTASATSILPRYKKIPSSTNRHKVVNPSE